MSVLKLIWKEAIGMFVDDGSLALMSVLLVAAVSALVAGMGLSALVAEIALPLGLALVLVASVRRACRSA